MDPRAAELQALLETPAVLTRRPTVPALEDQLYLVHGVLDHGFVRLIDYMGDDAAIVQAARVSYGRGTRSVTDDRGLIRYLMRHRHTTPFEMCEVKLHVKLPIFVARQWIRHRTANVNEYSARYSILDREFYLPAPEQIATQSSTNRQGRGEALSTEQAAEVLDLLRRDAITAYDTYEHLLNDSGDGTPVRDDAPQLARELARINLGLNYYTQWYWKTDLHNLFHFLSLRADAHAQYEIRVYADAIAALTKAWVPLAWEAFEDYRLGGSFMSGREVALLRRALAGESIEALLPGSGLSPRERREFREKLGLDTPKR
jgi:thymidylate synthase (FAD)